MYTVTIYTTGPACMACRMTKRAMDKAGITYTEVDLTTQPEAHTYLTDELGYSEAPVCIVEDGTDQHHWSGFRPDAIKNLTR